MLTAMKVHSPAFFLSEKEEAAHSVASVDVVMFERGYNIGAIGPDCTRGALLLGSKKHALRTKNSFHLRRCGVRILVVAPLDRGR